MKQKKALILGNGKLPGKNTIKYLISQGYDFIIAADGGANIAYKLGLLPDLVVGDFDSILPEIREYYSELTEVKYVKRQTDTDIEKAIKYAIAKKFDEAILLGASGDRLDHSFCNIGNILKYKGKIDVALLHEKTIAFVYDKPVCFPTEKGETISLYGIDDKTLITTRGLKFPLKKEPLPFGIRGGTSNEAVSNEVCLEIENGKIIVMREFKIVRKNAFLISR